MKANMFDIEVDFAI